MAIGNIYKVALVGEAQFGQQLVNTFHYRQTQDTIFDTPAEDLAQAALAELAPAHAAVRTVASALNVIQVRGVTNPLEGFDLPVTPPISGGRAGQALPPQASAVITWTTGLIGRRFRGRTFMWPASEADQDSGVLSSAYVTDLDTFADDILEIGDSITTAVYELMVWSEKFNVATLVTGHISRNILQTQRRRVTGVGS